MNKKAQFFIIAALVISSLILGVNQIYNSVQTFEEDKTVYDLSREINTESSYLIDSGVFQSANQSTLNNNLQQLYTIYADSNPESEITVIFGNENDLKILEPKSKTTTNLTSSKKTITQRTDSNLTRIEVDLDALGKKSFNLASSQNLYIIIKKEKKGETFISSNNYND